MFLLNFDRNSKAKFWAMVVFVTLFSFAFFHKDVANYFKNWNHDKAVQKAWVEHSNNEYRLMLSFEYSFKDVAMIISRDPIKFPILLNNNEWLVYYDRSDFTTGTQRDIVLRYVGKYKADKYRDEFKISPLSFDPVSMSLTNDKNHLVIKSEKNEIVKIALRDSFPACYFDRSAAC